mmetsp:Transcript_11752/g.26813  ORF Transcript_11752/g.26813 Transcript_11752/m.26813 type:complete len:101 (-) Transcript_11752:463-765(-)
MLWAAFVLYTNARRVSCDEHNDRATNRTTDWRLTAGRLLGAGGAQALAHGAAEAHSSAPWACRERFAERLSFCRRFNSPGGQRWQKAHSRPLRQPFRECA